MLDTNTYDDSPLISPKLRAFHGPALLVKNNQVFGEADFASLASIGDSRKRKPPSDQTVHKMSANAFQVMTRLLPENTVKDSTHVFIGQTVRGSFQDNGFSYWIPTENGPQTVVVQRIISWNVKTRRR